MTRPIQAPVKNIFSQFFSLNGREKMLFCEAWILLGRYRLQIRLMPFKQIVDSAPHHVTESHRPMSNTTQQVLITLISNAIRRAAKFTPWESACLVQALVARRMLYKRQVPGAFYLGVRTDKEQTKPNLAAHAWSKCDGIFITGEAGHKEYQIIQSYQWGSR